MLTHFHRGVFAHHHGQSSASLDGQTAEAIKSGAYDARKLQAVIEVLFETCSGIAAEMLDS